MEDISMDENKTQDKAPACIPFFAHENVLMHYNTANKRMLVALLAVCITFILTIVIFVCGYTVRERNWLETLKYMQEHPTVTEVRTDDRVQQQPDTVPH